MPILEVWQWRHGVLERDLILVLGVRVLNGQREIESLQGVGAINNDLTKSTRVDNVLDSVKPLDPGITSSVSVSWSAVVQNLNIKKGTWSPQHFR